MSTVPLPTAEQMGELFQAPAVRGTRKARIGLVGPSGSGKTFTMLRMATGLGGKVGVLDTEHRTSQLYADDFSFLPVYMDAPYSPQRYIGVIEAAKHNGIDVLCIDSLSHAWSGSGGVLEQVDAITGGNQQKTRDAWGKLTPVQQQLIEAILSYPGHVIVTMRTKDAYGQDPENPRKRVKVGLAPVQRNEVDYEFDVIMYLDQQHVGTVEKSRVSKVLPVNATIPEPGEATAIALAEWLASGAANGAAQAAEPPAQTTPAVPGPTVPAEPAAPQNPSEGFIWVRDAQGTRVKVPEMSLALMESQGWQREPNKPDPTPAPSAGTPGPSAPATPPSAAPPAAANGTSASPEDFDPFGDGISVEQVQAISDATGRLAELQPDKDWPGKVHKKLEEWFGAGTGIESLTSEQAVKVLDRLGTAERSVREKISG